MENAIDVWALANMAANALTQLTWSKSANFLQEHDMENSREDKNPAVTSGTQETDKETAVFLKRIWMRHASDSAHFVRVHQQLFLFCCWNQWNVARLRSLSAWMIVIHLFLLFRVGGRGGGKGLRFLSIGRKTGNESPTSVRHQFNSSSASLLHLLSPVPRNGLSGNPASFSQCGAISRFRINVVCCRFSFVLASGRKEKDNGMDGAALPNCPCRKNPTAIPLIGNWNEIVQNHRPVGELTGRGRGGRGRATPSSGRRGNHPAN